MPTIGPLTVSQQGYGAMGLSSTYGPAEDAESLKTLHRAMDLGITFFDTATAYGLGHNETLVGQAITARRKSLVIASKFTHRPAAGGDRVRPRQAIEASLKRLGLDHIDLYYLHRVDQEIPIEDSVGELGRAQDAGLIGAVGVSEANADQIRRAHATHSLAALQSEYSLWTRGVEVEILPTVRELGIGFVSYSPLGRGFLAGSEIVDEKDRRRQHPRFTPEAIAANSQRRETIEAVAKRHNASLSQVSLAWVLSKGVVPIPGTRRIAHLEANWAANDLVLSAADILELEEAYPLGSTTGDRYPPDGMRQVVPDPVLEAES